ncbi:hypothetical protein LIZ83_16315, partial [Mediterraneibacter faecis]|uniref:hypothetical protein n=1 Tax=Mediterraneibacter faecis TaxID=592978 RepID=UPI001D0934A2
ASYIPIAEARGFTTHWIRNTKALQIIPPQNKYSFKPSYLKKLFLLSSSSRTFCFITLVSVSDCFSRAFVALCTASILVKRIYSCVDFARNTVELTSSWVTLEMEK